MSNKTDWFMRSKWGVNIAFMPGIEEDAFTDNTLSADEWNKRVDNFDVQGLSEQLQTINAPYCFLTLGQNSGHYCSPNATYDKIVGISPSKCSARDLISDLADELATHNCRLLVYLPSGAPAADKIACERLKWKWGFEGDWPNGWCDNLRRGERLEQFQNNWEAVCREWSLRWSDKVWGWWIDGCYFADEMYRNPKAPNFKSFAEALKAGNENALVAFNPGQVFPVISHTKHEDFTAGEGSDTCLPLCEGRWIERDKHAVQWHTYNWIGTKWGRAEKPRFSAEMVIGYTKQATSNQGVVTWDVPYEENGLIKEEFFTILRELSDKVPPEKSWEA